jgi:hypothetical protein
MAVLIEGLAFGVALHCWSQPCLQMTEGNALCDVDFGYDANLLAVQ